MTKGRFSDRVGATQPRAEIQKTDIDLRLRNRLWNVFKSTFIEQIAHRRIHDSERLEDDALLRALWHDHFGEPIDNIPHQPHQLIDKLKAYFQNALWYEVYNLIEFVALATDQDRFRVKVNDILESDLAGHRFVGMHLVALTSPVEIESIEDAIAATRKHALGGAEVHLGAALRYFGADPTPDFRNAIKEAISAVESVAGSVAGKPGASLGDALKALANKGFDLDPALRGAFDRLYGWTSNEGGIRHGATEKPTVDAEDARFMIVACSAFVHYLVTKADKAGIKLG